MSAHAVISELVACGAAPRLTQDGQGIVVRGTLPQALRERVKAIGLKDNSKVFNTARIEALEVENLIEAAQATMVAAAARPESRGAHAHDDFPTRDDVNWMKHSLAWVPDVVSGQVRLGYRAVTAHTLTDEVAPVPPMKRVY